MDLLNTFLVTTSVVAFAYTVHLVYLDKIRLRSGTVAEATSRKRARLLRAGPVVYSILATIVFVIALSLRNSKSEACSQEDNEINPDIGGIGVLLGLFLPCFVLLVVLFFGHFTAHTSGAKEICMAQFANLLYLTINLLKGRKKLNTQELVIALSSIDAISASISMAFSDKDVLAARTLVAFAFLTQIAAYCVQAAAFSEYMGRDKLQCEHSKPHQLSSQHFSTAYWIYWSFRFVASVLPCHVAYRLTSSLNKIENKHKSSRSVRVEATALWKSLPATIATSYLIYWPFVLVHGLSIYNILRGTNTIKQSWLTLTTEWGQSANAIIAIFAIVHVVYAIYRIFVAESTDDGGPLISQAYPRTGWTTWKYWPWNAKWWPFRLGLDYSDHLLVDEDPLQRILGPPLQQTPEVREDLLQRLMVGFTDNEPDVIFDCLDRGAPVNEPNDDGDYPIHLAARHNNIDMLKGTRFHTTRDSVTHDSLLLEDSASETPLEIACNAGTLKAVRWIMEHLPKTHTRAKDVVRQSFQSAILADKESVLKILRDLWPGWRALEMRIGTSNYSPLRFALLHKKPKSAFRLINPSIRDRQNPSARRLFELSWGLNMTAVEVILDDRRDELSADIFQMELIEEVIRSPAIDSGGALELLQALEADPLEILQESIYYAVSPESNLDPKDSMWEHVLQAGYTFGPEHLDSIITFQFPNEDEVLNDSCETRELELQQRRIKLQKDRIKKALMRRGACDWSKTVKASTDASTRNLESLINSEKDQTMLRRMLNVKDAVDRSILSLTIAHGCDEIFRGRGRTFQYMGHVGLLLEHGSCVEESDLAYAASHFKPRDGNVAFFMLLAAHTKEGVASAMLRTMCSGTGIRHSHHKLIQVLLRSGANPTIKNENGILPRQDLQFHFEAASKRRSNKLGIPRLDEQARASLTIGQCGDFPKILDLLQRWENYYNDPQTGKPSERPDEDWKAVRDDLRDEATWEWLVEKNPEGYKVVEDR